MFEHLQKKWNVGGRDLIAILFTFAIGGSLSGFLGRKIMSISGIDDPVWWTVTYTIILCVIWPAVVLGVSIIFGQFGFFKRYIKKVVRRMSGRKELQFKPKNLELAFANLSTTSNEISAGTGKATSRKIRLAIFASGAGSNAEQIISHFKNHSDIVPALIVCNKPGAGVISIAGRERVPVMMIEKEKFFRGNGYVDELKAADIDLIILAGFLWKLPGSLVKAYPKKIINIHPALLPKYGGKGMYGKHVHEAVINAKEKSSGITIHYVDEIFDHGETIFQATCEIDENDTPETLAQKIHKLEHEFYPRVIESVLKVSR